MVFLPRLTSDWSYASRYRLNHGALRRAGAGRTDVTNRSREHLREPGTGAGGPLEPAAGEGRRRTAPRVNPRDDHELESPSSVGGSNGRFRPAARSTQDAEKRNESQEGTGQLPAERSECEPLGLLPPRPSKWNVTIPCRLWSVVWIPAASNHPRQRDRLNAWQALMGRDDRRAPSSMVTQGCASAEIEAKRVARVEIESSGTIALDAIASLCE